MFNKSFILAALASSFVAATQVHQISDKEAEKQRLAMCIYDIDFDAENADD